MRRALEVNPGPCRWEPFARHALAALGTVSLLLAPTSWGWKAAGLAALAGVWRYSARSTDDPATTLTLHPDGTASLARDGREQPVELTGRAWLSRVICVVAVQRSSDGATEWMPVCAANHSAAVYRRFLGALRLRAFTAPETGLD